MLTTMQARASRFAGATGAAEKAGPEDDRGRMGSAEQQPLMRCAVSPSGAPRCCGRATPGCGARWGSATRAATSACRRWARGAVRQAVVCRVRVLSVCMCESSDLGVPQVGARHCWRVCVCECVCACVRMGCMALHHRCSQPPCTHPRPPDAPRALPHAAPRWPSAATGARSQTATGRASRFTSWCALGSWYLRTGHGWGPLLDTR